MGASQGSAGGGRDRGVHSGKGTDYQPGYCQENLHSTAAPNRRFNANVCLHRVV